MEENKNLSIATLTLQVSKQFTNSCITELVKMKSNCEEEFKELRLFQEKLIDRKNELERSRLNILERERITERNVRKAIVDLQTILKDQAKVILKKSKKETARLTEEIDSLSKNVDSVLIKIQQIEPLVESFVTTEPEEDEQLKQLRQSIHSIHSEKVNLRIEKLSFDYPFSLDVSPVKNAIEDLTINFDQTAHNESVNRTSHYTVGVCKSGFIFSPLTKWGTFWVQPVIEHSSSELIKLSEKIRLLFINDLDWQTFSMLNISPEVGSIVFVRLPPDYKWYRAIVCELISFESKCSVTCLDYGSHHQVEFSNILPNRETDLLTDISNQAIECCLFEEENRILPLALQARWVFNDIMKSGSVNYVLNKKIYHSRLKRDIWLTKVTKGDQNVNETVLSTAPDENDTSIVCRDIRLQDEHHEMTVIHCDEGNKGEESSCVQSEDHIKPEPVVNEYPESAVGLSPKLATSVSEPARVSSNLEVSESDEITDSSSVDQLDNSIYKYVSHIIEDVIRESCLHSNIRNHAKLSKSEDVTDDNCNEPNQTVEKSENSYDSEHPTEFNNEANLDGTTNISDGDVTTVRYHTVTGAHDENDVQNKWEQDKNMTDFCTKFIETPSSTYEPIQGFSNRALNINAAEFKPKAVTETDSQYSVQNHYRFNDQINYSSLNLEVTNHSDQHEASSSQCSSEPVEPLKGSDSTRPGQQIKNINSLSSSDYNSYDDAKSESDIAHKLVPSDELKSLAESSELVVSNNQHLFTENSETMAAPENHDFSRCSTENTRAVQEHKLTDNEENSNMERERITDDQLFNGNEYSSKESDENHYNDNEDSYYNNQNFQNDSNQTSQIFSTKNDTQNLPMSSETVHRHQFSDEHSLSPNQTVNSSNSNQTGLGHHSSNCHSSSSSPTLSSPSHTFMKSQPTVSSIQTVPAHSSSTIDHSISSELNSVSNNTSIESHTQSSNYKHSKYQPNIKNCKCFKAQIMAYDLSSAKLTLELAFKQTDLLSTLSEISHISSTESNLKIGKHVLVLPPKRNVWCRAEIIECTNKRRYNRRFQSFSNNDTHKTAEKRNAKLRLIDEYHQPFLELNSKIKQLPEKFSPPSCPAKIIECRNTQEFIGASLINELISDKTIVSVNLIETESSNWEVHFNKDEIMKLSLPLKNDVKPLVLDESSVSTPKSHQLDLKPSEKEVDWTQTPSPLATNENIPYWASQKAEPEPLWDEQSTPKNNQHINYETKNLESEYNPYSSSTANSVSLNNRYSSSIGQSFESEPTWGEENASSDSINANLQTVFSESSQAAQSSQNFVEPLMKNISCFECGLPGHVKRHCPSTKSNAFVNPKHQNSDSLHESERRFSNRHAKSYESDTRFGSSQRSRNTSDHRRHDQEPSQQLNRSNRSNRTNYNRGENRSHVYSHNQSESSYSDIRRSSSSSRTSDSSDVRNTHNQNEQYSQSYNHHQTGYSDNRRSSSNHSRSGRRGGGHDYKTNRNQHEHRNQVHDPNQHQSRYPDNRRSSSNRSRTDRYDSRDRYNSHDRYDSRDRLIKDRYDDHRSHSQNQLQSVFPDDGRGSSVYGRTGCKDSHDSSKGQGKGFRRNRADPLYGDSKRNNSEHRETDLYKHDDRQVESFDTGSRDSQTRYNCAPPDQVDINSPTDFGSADHDKSSNASTAENKIETNEFVEKKGRKSKKPSHRSKGSCDSTPDSVGVSDMSSFTVSASASAARKKKGRKK